MLMGALMSVYLPMNGAVSKYLGSAMAATITFFSVALVTAIFLFIFWGEHSALGKLRQVPSYLYLSGFISAFMIVGTTFLIPHLGARRFFILLISGQVLMAIVVSHFGILESPKDAINIKKLCGAALVMAGVFLSTG
jgi:transporter family-2 protein